VRLTVRRQQNPGRKGTTFTLFFHLGLLPDEQALVDQHGLHSFRIGTAGELKDLQGGVEREVGVMIEPIQERVWTRAGAHIQDAIKMENEVKKSCRNFVAVLDNLRAFNGEHTFDYHVGEVNEPER
jgi:hypothetical protein